MRIQIIGIGLLMALSLTGIHATSALRKAPKATLNIRNELGRTPLLQAIIDEDAGQAMKLLLQGANPSTPDTDGYSPLHAAVARGMVVTVMELLGHKANPDVRDSSGYTPLHLAVIQPDEDAARNMTALLLMSKANPSAQNFDGDTAAMLAAYNERSDLFDLVALEEAYDWGIMNRQGQSTRAIALQYLPQFGFRESESSSDGSMNSCVSSSVSSSSSNESSPATSSEESSTSSSSGFGNSRDFKVDFSRFQNIY